MKKFVSSLFVLLSFGLIVSCGGGDTPSEKVISSENVSVEISSEEESIFNPFISQEIQSTEEVSIESTVKSDEITTGPDTPAPSEDTSVSNNVTSVENPTTSENTPVVSDTPINSSEQQVEITVSEDADSGSWTYPETTN